MSVDIDGNFVENLHVGRAVPLGVKHDTGKPLIADMIQDYKVQLLELCKVFEYGTKTYGLGNWKQLEDGKERLTNAMIRHFLKEDEVYDEETGLLHAAQVFFNAGGRLYFILKEMEEKENK